MIGLVNRRRVRRTLKPRRVISAGVIALLVLLLVILFGVRHGERTNDKTVGKETESSSVFGIGVEELAKNIRQSMARYDRVKVDAQLRAKRGPPSYRIQHDSLDEESDSVSHVKARFFTAATTMSDMVRAHIMSAVFTGINVEVIGLDWNRFSFVGRQVAYLEAMLDAENNTGMLKDHRDEDIIVISDADAFYAGDQDFYPFIQKFASLTAHSEAEHLHITTPPPPPPPPSPLSPGSRGNDDTDRWARYVRDIRTGTALPPILHAGETNCFHSLLFNASSCEHYYNRIDNLTSLWLSEQRAGKQTKPEGEYYTFSSKGKLPYQYLNAGFVVARVWALRRMLNAMRAVLLAAVREEQRLLNACPPHLRAQCTYDHVVHRDDQGFLGALHVINRVREFLPGGPLSVSGTETALLSPYQNEALHWMREDYSSNPLVDTQLSDNPTVRRAYDSNNRFLDLPFGLIELEKTNNLVLLVTLGTTELEANETAFLLHTPGLEDTDKLVVRTDTLAIHEKRITDAFFESQAQGGRETEELARRSFLGNRILGGVLQTDEKQLFFYCRESDAKANGQCSSKEFHRSILSAAASVAPGSPAQPLLPLLWHFAGLGKHYILSTFFKFLPFAFPLLNSRADPNHVNRDLGRLVNLLPPVRLWRFEGTCTDFTRRGGEIPNGGQGKGSCTLRGEAELITLHALGCARIRNWEQKRCYVAYFLRSLYGHVKSFLGRRRCCVTCDKSDWLDAN